MSLIGTEREVCFLVFPMGVKLRLNFTRDLSLDELSKIISSVIRECNFPSRTIVHLVHHLIPDVGNPTTF